MCCKNMLLKVFIGSDSSVGIATVYRLDDLGIESRWGRDFPHLSRPAHPASCKMGTGSFPGVKCGRGVMLTPPSSAEVKNRVELYLYSPQGPSWPMKGCNLPTESIQEAEGRILVSPALDLRKHMVFGLLNCHPL